MTSLCFMAYCSCWFVLEQCSEACVSICFATRSLWQKNWGIQPNKSKVQLSNLPGHSRSFKEVVQKIPRILGCPQVIIIGIETLEDLRIWGYHREQTRSLGGFCEGKKFKWRLPLVLTMRWSFTPRVLQPRMSLDLRKRSLRQWPDLHQTRFFRDFSAAFKLFVWFGLVGWLVWLVGWLVCLVGWFVCLVGWLVGLFVCLFVCLYVLFLNWESLC